MAAAGFTLPKLRPVPRGNDAELEILRAEHLQLSEHGDAALERLREAAAKLPDVAWSEADFTARIGTGWRVEWQQSHSESRRVLLTRSVPRLTEWSDYLAFVNRWSVEPGIVVEGFEVRATGPARNRQLSQVTVTLKVALAGAPLSRGEPDAPSRVPLPATSAGEAAATRKIGAVLPLRRPAAFAEPPASGAASAPVRPDPPGARAAIRSSQP